MPVSGTFDVSLGSLVLTFDKPLVVGALDERDWTVNADASEWDPDTAAVPAGNPLTVVSTYTRGGAGAGETVRYTAVAGDLVGQNGQPVAAFVFPITVVP